MARRSGRGNGNTMTVWDLANSLHPENAIANLPPVTTDSGAAASEYIGRLCLLTYTELSAENWRFTKRSTYFFVSLPLSLFPSLLKLTTVACNHNRNHLLSKVKAYESEEGYLIQPINGMGEEEGKPMVEKVGDVWVLPTKGEAK